MAKQYKTGVLITGDATKGVRAVKLTQEEIKKLNETQRRGSRYGRDYARSQKTVASTIMSAKVAILAGGVALTAMTKKALDNADAIGKQADKVGLSTSAWQEYVFAASQSGVSQASLTSGMGALNKRVGELQNGTGQLTTFLKKYDEELYENVKASSSTEEAAKLIFGAMGDAETSMDRAALAAAAFGRTAGIDMQNMVRGGAQELENMRQKANDLGLVLDEELIRKSEEMNDKLDVASRIIGAELTTAFVELSPLLVAAAQGFATLARMIGEAFGAMDEFINGIDTTGVFTKQQTANRALVLEVDKLSQAWLSLEKALATYEKGSVEYTVTAAAMDEVQANILDKLAQIGPVSQEAAKAIEIHGTKIDDAAKKQKAALSPMGEYVKQLMSMQEEANMVGPKLETLGLLFASGAIDVEVYKRALQDLGFEIGEGIPKAADKAGESVSEMGETIENMLENIQSGWGNLFNDELIEIAERWGIEMDGVFGVVAKSFLRMVSEMAAAWTAEAIFGGGIKSANALFTGANVASNSSGSGGLLASAAGGLGKLFGGASTTTGGGFSVPAGVATTTSGGGFSAPAAAGGSSSLLATAGWAAGAVGIGVAISKAFSDARESVASDVTDMFGVVGAQINNTEVAAAGMGETLGVVMKNGAESSELLKSALKSVNAEFDSGGKGILKITSNAEKARAVTNAWTSDAVSGMNAQVRALMSSAAHTGQYENSAMALRGAIEKVAEEFSNSATEAAGLASAINSIPKEVTTTLTTVRRSVSAGSGNGGGGDSFASGTGGQWYRVPYDGYSPTFHRDELFKVIPRGEANQSATPAGSGGSGDLEGYMEASLRVQSRQSEQIRLLAIAVDRMNSDNVTVGQDIKQQIRAIR